VPSFTHETRHFTGPVGGVLGSWLMVTLPQEIDHVRQS
jgi:hypothetical protein